MIRRRRTLALTATLTATAALLLAGCATPAAPNAGGGDNPDAPVPAADLPAWYGTELDAEGCPVPASGASFVRLDLDEFLQTPPPAGWCTYGHTDYVQYYALPADPAGDFGGEVRSTLEPAGWQFDAADDDSPQWSWITAYPPGSEADFTDGAVDGAILTAEAVTQEDLDNYRIWFSGLDEAFGGAWAEGDKIAIVGFW